MLQNLGEEKLVLAVTNCLLRGWVSKDILENKPNVEKRFERLIFKTREFDGSFRKDVNARENDFIQAKVIDRNTGQLYNDDPVEVIALKCLFISMINIPRFVVAFVGSIGCTAVSLAQMPLYLAKELVISFDSHKEMPRLTTRVVAQICEGTSRIFQAVWQVLRLPYYALGLQIAVVAGFAETVFCWDGNRALQARVVFATIERNWNHDVGVEESSKLGEHLYPNAFYIAQCFQSKKHIDQMVNGHRRYEVIATTHPLVDAARREQCPCQEAFSRCL